METFANKVLENRIYKNIDGKLLGRALKIEHMEYSVIDGARIKLLLDKLDGSSTNTILILQWSDTLFDITSEWESNNSKKELLESLEEKIIYMDNWLPEI